MSPAPSNTSATSDTENDFESPKTIVETPNNATPPNIHLPTWTLDGRQANCDRGERRTDARRGAQHSEAGGANVQYVAGECGQERRGAAEQHGKQVERDRAQHDRPVQPRNAGRRAGLALTPSLLARTARTGLIVQINATTTTTRPKPTL